MSGIIVLLLFFGIIGVIVWGVVQAIRGFLLNRMGNKIFSNQNNYIVDEYIALLEVTRINNHPKNWQRLRGVFFAVYNSKTVSGDLKKRLYNELLRKGCILGNVRLNFETDEERVRKSGEEGENRVAYNLKWLSEEYRVLSNIKLNSGAHTQEFDNILIGPNGVFHIETKNHGGDRGCKIRINKSGDWSREDAGVETGVESPEFQLQRHDKVLKDNLDKHYGANQYIPHGIIVLSNPKTILEGAENSDVPVIKADALVKYINKYEGHKKLSQAEINSIYEKLQFIKR